MLQPAQRAPGLSKEDRAQLLNHLDTCLALFDRRLGSLNAPEIMMKSMISAIRSQVRQHTVLIDGQAGVESKDR